MPKSKEAKERRAQRRAAAAVGPIVARSLPVVEEVVEPGKVESKKKGYYNKEAAKAYRDRIKEFAIKGGYVLKERAPGGGLTEKRVSQKSGKAYYYTPWSALTAEQKEIRLAQARERMSRDRVDAAKYREAHPELYKKEK